MAKQKKYHFIYKTTCSITGKFYVGMHSTNDLSDGYLGSGKILGYSRKKYGDENHKLEILEHCSSRGVLKLREKEIVNEEMLSHPLNMNLKYGGDGGWDVLNKEGRNLYGNNGKPGFGGENLSKPESRTKANKTRWERDRKQMLEYSAQGLKNAVKAAASREAIEKRKATLVERRHSQGEKNSQFGSCWVVKDTKPIKIKKEQLDEYIRNGYSRGRK